MLFPLKCSAKLAGVTGSGLIFDINTASREQQTDPIGGGFSFDKLEADYLCERPKLVKDLFGFCAASGYKDAYGFDCLPFLWS